MSTKNTHGVCPQGTVPAIDTRTRLFGVIGAPVGHSLSPAMHNAALQAMGYGAVYLAFHVTDPAGALAGMRALGIGGLSITIPHKVAIIDSLDELDPLAHRIGAVNTVVPRDGLLIGFNTDCFGAVAALKETIDPAGQQVALLGAGGAARAVGFGLMDAGARVTLFNRSAGRGDDLARTLGVDCHPLNELRHHQADILINTTSLGMRPETARTPVPPNCLRPGMVVMDIVYNPLETRLLRDARAAGCDTIDGVAMFVYQGARQIELWTGRTAPVDIMRRAVLAGLK
ncbi:MAG: shikimate dehydrogenase [Desulfatitalea sp.]|nr:shikimate dehydrogenase [Desulfatitalea sp.]